MMLEAVFRTRLTFLALICALAGLFTAEAVAAGALTVFPVRVEVGAGKQFCSITIGNDGQEDVTVQIRGFRWHQSSGTDELDEKEGIAINPAIVTIPAGTKKLVRCSLPEQIGPVESTYRLIVTELPRGDAEAGTLQTLLQLSIPIFRAYPDARPSLRWAETADGRIALTNVGTRHIRIAELVASTATGAPVDAEANFYLLAGASRVVDLGVAAATISNVEAVTEDGVFLTVLPDPPLRP